LGIGTVPDSAPIQREIGRVTRTIGPTTYKSVAGIAIAVIVPKRRSITVWTVTPG